MDETTSGTFPRNRPKLFAALAKAQAEIKTALKDAANPFFNAKYADLASVWEACRGPLTKNGLCVTQLLDCTSDGWIVLNTILGHESGEFLESCAPIRPAQPTPQGMGSAITYMRRYSLAAIVGVAPEEDDDDGNLASGKQQPPKITSKPKEPSILKPVAPLAVPIPDEEPLKKIKLVTQEQIVRLYTIAKECSWTHEMVIYHLKDRLHKTSSKDLRQAEYDQFIEYMKKNTLPKKDVPSLDAESQDKIDKLDF